MDLLFWKNLIPEINVNYTQKLFFKQHPYKLELLANGGQSINSKLSIDESIEIRKASYRKINHAGSWWAVKMYAQTKKADTDWLNYIKNYKTTNIVNDTIRLRIEEPKVQIYFNEKSDMINFLSNIPTQFKKYTESISIPRNEQELEILMSGKKILKNSPKYKFKINFRDGKYDLLTKNHILNYLDRLGDLVQVPEHCRKEMTKTHSATWDCYVYSHDISILTFLQIIEPRLVRSVIEMASIADINMTNNIQGS